MSPIQSNIFSMGMNELESWLWSFFSLTLGEVSFRCHKLAHASNPWLVRMIFIGLFIIKFIVINVQIGRVCKYGSKTSTIKSILCLTILNDFFYNEIGTYKKNNLMFAQLSMQYPLTCTTNILGERKWDLVCHIWTLLASYHPCMVGYIWIIYPMGDIGVRDQCGLFNIHLHNVFYNFIFDKPTFLDFNCV